MPYIPKEQREWMTLRQVISHIQHVDGCDEAAAIEQLRQALAHGEITVHMKTHYKNSPTDEFFEISYKGWRDPQWSRDKYWLSVPIKLNQDRSDAIAQSDDAKPAEIDDRKRAPHAGAYPAALTDAGHADEDLNDVEENEEDLSPIPYPLLFSRTLILGIWWEESLISGEDEKSGKNKGSALKRAKKKDILDIARLLYGQDPERPPNNRKAPPEIKKLLAEKGMYVTREKIREVLKEDEFKSKRRLPGERVRKG
jgi:hypothetical protein